MLLSTHLIRGLAAVLRSRFCYPAGRTDEIPYSRLVARGSSQDSITVVTDNPFNALSTTRKAQRRSLAYTVRCPPSQSGVSNVIRYPCPSVSMSKCLSLTNARTRRPKAKKQQHVIQ